MFQAPNLVGSRDCLPSQAGAWAPETEPAQPFRFLSPSIVPQKQKREWFASLLSAPVQQHPHIESALTAPTYRECAHSTPFWFVSGDRHC